MNRLYIITILFCFAGFVYGQNQKVLDLSYGGVSIKEVEVVKDENNNFIVLCNTNIEFNQIILNANKKDTVVVNKSEKRLFSEFSQKKTNIQKKGDKNMTIFSFENGHNYQIVHNGKTWNIKVRKKGYITTDLYPKEKNLHIGDSCVQLRDTMHVTFPDSIILGKWDTGITLTKNGKLLTDSLCINVDDTCCYFTKINMSSDSVLRAKDILCININNKKYILVCDEVTPKDSNKWGYLIIIASVFLVLFLIGLKFRQEITAAYLAFKKGNKEKKTELPNSTQGIAKSIEEKTELFNELEGLIKKIRTAIEYEQTLANHAWQTKFEELLNNYTELQNSYNEDLEKAKEQAKSEAKEELNKHIADLERKVEEAEANAKTAIETKDTVVNEAIRKEKESHKDETLRLEKEKKDAEEKAEKAEKTKKQAVEDAVRKEKALHEKTEKELKDAKEKVEKDFKEKSLSYEKSQKELFETKVERDKKNEEVKQLKIAQEEYSNSLERVPFAEQYSKQIRKIMELGRKIQTSAYSLLDSNIEDPYFIMKALSKYGKMIDGINMENFYTDVNLSSKAKFILKDSFLAKFKEDNKDIDSIMRSYFFNQYLEKYINSIMVLNEAMCGLKLLIPKLQSRVGCFEQYRNELLDLAKKLKINVLFVKVGDMAGVNIDLRPTVVDVEIGKPGQILEIQNCIVYQSDKSKPQTRINVTIKK